MNAKRLITDNLLYVVRKLTKEPTDIQVSISEKAEQGDYYTNVALRLASILHKKPLDIAYKIKGELEKISELGPVVSKIETASPGFVNFFLSEQYLQETAEYIDKKGEEFGVSEKLKGQKIMVEYAHPNTHKEMHIGHMRTLITGEALARMFESQGATVLRANYQGDIGPHVAKALYGIKKIMEEENLSIEKIEKWSNIEKAHFLGRGYVRGNRDYERHKEEIDSINTDLYDRNKTIWPLYERTRRWNLDYYDEFYTRFYTKFDHLFFESEMDEKGARIVGQHIGDVFEEESGAVIFPGEKYGLHTRVFITAAGHVTYEGKEMANGEAEYKVFPFDRKIHVVASEQAGYFQVVFKALELIDPEKFKGKQEHVSMGMVHLSDRKMSSRTGDVLTVDWLIDEVKERVRRTVESAKVSKKIGEEQLEPVTIGAIKYSVLKHGTGQDAAFDIEQSVSLEGNSGPYLQYSYVRTRSVINKYKISNIKNKKNITKKELNLEELSVLRNLVHFPEIVSEAQERLAPNMIAEYLFDLASKFNLFYQKHRIAGNEFRLSLTEAVGQTLKTGINLLGIVTVDKM